MNPPIIERLRDVHRIDYATRIEAAGIITDLLEASEKATQWMNDPRMGQWNYIEGPHFFADKTRICGELEDAIARTKGEQETVGDGVAAGEGV